MHLGTSEVEESVTESYVFWVAGILIDGHGEGICDGEDIEGRDLDFDIACGNFRVDGFLCACDDGSFDADDAFEGEVIEGGEEWGGCGDDELYDSVTVTEVDKEESAVVTFSVQPP